jgi:hypothetical protein
MRSLLISLVSLGLLAHAADLAPVVEISEGVYTYTNANNGAGPMWCAGSTCLVRSGERLFASGLETVAGDAPLNNCRWFLLERQTNGWQRVWIDTDGRTREPCPIAGFADGRLLLSVNPTLGKGPQPNGGPAQPEVLQFNTVRPNSPPVALEPLWQGTPLFTEHSYRSLAADTKAGELVLFQNVGYTHAEWTFLSQAGRWSAQGQLKWPWGSEYDKPGPIRVCYPNVALRDRAVHFIGVSDILEPCAAWRDFKRELTGRQWDYDFRRLFYTWTPDITKQPFAPWVEIASRDKTCGWISPGDLWLAPNGDAHVVWTERAIDERLRSKFFPAAKQTNSLNYAVIRDGKVTLRRPILETTEDTPGVSGSAGRFCVTPSGRLFVAHLASGTEPSGRRVFENRVVEISPDGALGTAAPIRLEKPFTTFFTTTVRAGSPPSNHLEMLGLRDGAPNTLSYARVRLFDGP